jgi:cytochrome oxidase assembly protein ShyY1
MYRFLLTPRWLGGVAVALALAALCVLLGTWQWDRREQRLAANAPVLENYDDPARPVEQVLPSRHAPLPPAREWTPVRVSGEYLTSGTLLLRNRPLDGRPGYHVLVPLRLDGGGDLLLVDRGWVPAGRSGSGPDAVPAPPTGEVEAIVRLRRPEPAADREAPPGQLLRIDLGAAAGLLGREEGGSLRSGAYGVLDAETPAPGQAPVPLPRPALAEGPHLSYSLQWFVFAAGVLVGYGVLASRTASDLAAAGPPSAAPPAPRRPRRVSAEEEEDAILDAAERTRTQH